MITYQQVTKQYGKITAVDGLDLEIQSAEFFGLLGPNGAGKTTIIRMTTALTPVSSGTIAIDGELIHRDLTKTKQRIGVVPQYSNLESELTARENLEYHGRLYGMPTAIRQGRIAELLDFAELTERADEKTNGYSGGMRRRLMIIKALIHNPDIIFLDEPTVGLDVAARRKIWDLLRAMNSNGLTIFLTTHYLEEAQALCQRVGLIDQGKLIRVDTTAAIIKEHGSYVLEYFQDGSTAYRFFHSRDEAIEAAKEINGVFQIRETNLEDAFIKLANRRIEDQ